MVLAKVTVVLLRTQPAALLMEKIRVRPAHTTMGRQPAPRHALFVLLELTVLRLRRLIALVQTVLQVHTSWTLLLRIPRYMLP